MHFNKYFQNQRKFIDNIMEVFFVCFFQLQQQQVQRPEDAPRPEVKSSSDKPHKTIYAIAAELKGNNE